MRAFIALPVAPEVRARIGELILDLKRTTPLHSVRWTRPEQIHLTLRFLGDVPDSAADEITAEIRRAAEGIKGIALHTTELGFFGAPQRPRVLWLGLAGDLDPLRELQRRIAETTAAFGEREDREFHPHLTLGRVNDIASHGRRDLVEATQRTRAGQPSIWKASFVELISSQLGPGGSRYTVLTSIPLATL